jgi:hypothetical protein
MIRPFTGLCMLLAAGSGLYLYQVKHRAELLDREIMRTVEATRVAQERAAALSAEYTRLTQPDRLQDLAGRFLTLRPTQPTQYVQFAELAAHLPAVQATPAETAPPPEPDASPVAAAQPDTATVPVAIASNAAPAATSAAGQGQPQGSAAAPAAAPAATSPAASSPPAPKSVAHAPSRPARPDVIAAADRAALRPRPPERPVYRAPEPASVYQAAAESVPRAAPPATVFAGSALGEASHVALAPPVPIGR